MALGWRANSGSQAAGMVPSAGGFPLAGVNGSGVEWGGGRGGGLWRVLEELK